MATFRSSRIDSATKPLNYSDLKITGPAHSEMVKKITLNTLSYTTLDQVR